jgi:hypothetical protein
MVATLPGTTSSGARLMSVGDKTVGLTCVWRSHFALATCVFRKKVGSPFGPRLKSAGSGVLALIESRMPSITGVMLCVVNALAEMMLP